MTRETALFLLDNEVPSAVQAAEAAFYKAETAYHRAMAAPMGPGVIRTRLVAFQTAEKKLETLVVNLQTVPSL